MSVFSYFQYLLLAVSRLEDYGLTKAVTSNSESRPSGELFINIKVELIDNSVLFIREYIIALNFLKNRNYTKLVSRRDRAKLNLHLLIESNRNFL